MIEPKNVMNQTISELVDHLVEGSLRPSELREAVQRLDETADGWRRCALAFLEAQCWTEAMRGTEDSNALESPLPAVRTLDVHSMEPRRAHVRAWSTWPLRGLAASLLMVAFGLGWMGRGLSPSAISQDSGSAERVAAARRDQVEPAPVTRAVLSSKESVSRPNVRPEVDRSSEVREVGWVRIGDAKSPVAEVPILAGKGIDERWLLQQPPAISDRQRAQWERQGYQLEEHRQLVGVSLPDGRQAAVPIDQVRVRYVGHNPL